MTTPQNQPDEQERRPKKRHRLTVGLTVAGAVILLGYGYYWWTQSRFVESTDDAYVGGDITTISAKVAGYVANIAVTDNQAVRAGELLLQLDDRDYRAELAKAEGEIAAQQAALVNLASTRSLKEALVEQARATIAGDDAQIQRTRDDLARYKTLQKGEAVSVQSLQKAEADFRQAVADGQQAQAVLLAAQRQLSVIDSQKGQILAALDQATAGRDLARLNLEYTQIRSPINGVVGNRRARLGAWAGAGSQLLEIIPARGLWVDANFKEDQLGEMRPGQRATVRADIQPGRLFHGTVASLAPATGAQFSVLPTENATGNFTKIVQRVPVRITLDKDDGTLGLLRPGLSVTAAIDSRGTERP
ncbi:HlyD family secretion protein [Sodalis sp. RH16]|jgi:membrane fusion protein (multidrug efflux system)|uniref:HlyD family secretion protein n=1 Tax=unclassified Sodalis (in: enterobacteria) TaxID=2636512 RepID=UPI0039B3825B